MVTSGREAKCELASLELPDVSLEFGRRMSWLWAARRAFKTMDTRAFLTCVRASSHTQGIMNGELVQVWRKVKKNRTDVRKALVTHRCMVQPLLLAKRRIMCLCLIAVV